MARRSSSGRVSAFRRTPLFAAIACALAQGALAGSFSVTNANDSGNGSLRKAIDDANLACLELSDPNSIITFFNGPFTITPSTPLPPIACQGPSTAYYVTLDAQNQGVSYGAVLNSDSTGFNATFGVKLDGSSIFSGGACGLQYVDNGYGGQLVVAGMEIANFNYGASGYGLCADNVRAVGNRFANNAVGMRIGNGSQVGNYPAGDRNVIVGSAVYYGSGIEVRGGTYSIINNLIGTPDGTSEDLNYEGIAYTGCCTAPAGAIFYNVIASSGYANIDLAFDSFSIYSNKIGTNAAGTSLLGSASFGISLYYSYGASISNNVIAGSLQNGVDSYNGENVSITGNQIGTTADGSEALGNGTGIYDEQSLGTYISGNVISGNLNYGIWLRGTFDSEVNDNFIGTNYGGTIAIPNDIGVYLGASPTGSFSGNTISGNDGTGFWSSDASNVSLTGNFIGTTTGGGSALPNQGEGVFAECGTGLYFYGNNISSNYRAGVSLSGILSSWFDSNLIRSNGYYEYTSNGVNLNTSDCSGGLDQQLRAKVLARAKAFAPNKPLTRAKSLARTAILARTKGLAKGITPGAPNHSDGNTFYANVIADNTGLGVWNLGGNNNFFESNEIRSNQGDGIRIDSESDVANPSPATGNTITRGSIYGNRDNNIKLGDGTPNNRQERPENGTAVRDSGTGKTIITFELTSGPGTYRIELFQNLTPGKPAGEVWNDSQDLVLASPGTKGSVTFYLNSLFGDYFSATATHVETGDTSEFAEIVSVTTASVPAADVLPTSIDFGDVVVGRQSSQGTISITSQGTAPYVINQLRDGNCDTSATICSSGSFVCSTNCSEGSPYSRGLSCTITASFAPTALGPQSKTLALCDNTADSPRTLTFSGNGILAPEVDIVMAPTSYYFGEVLVGAQSPSKSFTVTNMGTQPVYLSNAKVNPADFVLVGSTCSSTLAGGASCATDVSFLPSGRGVVFGSLEVTGSNAPIAAVRRSKVSSTTNTVSATLQGSGVQFGDLRLPSSIAFGTRILHGSPARQTVTINNGGNGTLSISNISVAGPFTLGNSCPATLASGASCTITLDFNPATLGTFNGTLTIVSDAPGGNRSIPITAQVIADARPVVTVSPTTIGFGQRTVGTDSPARRVTITNEGAETATLGALAFVQPQENATEFSVASSNCTGTLAPQATCFADIVFKALGFGERNGRMLVPSNAADSPQSVTLGGTGCRPFTAGSNRSGRDPCAP